MLKKKNRTSYKGNSGWVFIIRRKNWETINLYNESINPFKFEVMSFKFLI